MTERQRPRQPEFTLPPDLAAVFRQETGAARLWPHRRGTLLVFRAPAEHLATLQGPTTPLRITHQLYSKPTAPVIRTLLRWYDHPGSERVLDTFTNPADPDQAAAYRRLSQQATVSLLGYNEQLVPTVRKTIVNQQQRQVSQITELADKLLWTIPEDEYDFEAAVARVRESLRPYEP